MSPLKYSTTVICALFITIGAASGQEEKVYAEVGGKVSFGATSLNQQQLNVSSIIWKQRNEPVIKAIEWDTEDGVNVPNPRFKDITTLDKETGQITITNLKFEHSGLYTIDINGKEQEKIFKLEVLPPVPKPVIKIEKIEVNPDAVYLISLLPKPVTKIEKIKVNPDAVYLICEYSETIIWKNSTGGTLKGSPHSPKGELITVEKQGNPDFFYTCTLENALRNSTSDPVYERDLFKESGLWWTAFIIIPILILVLFVLLYKVWSRFHRKKYNVTSKEGFLLKFSIISNVLSVLSSRLLRLHQTASSLT